MRDNIIWYVQRDTSRYKNLLKNHLKTKIAIAFCRYFR